DDPHSQTSAFARWSVKASGLQHPKLGVVTCLRPSQTGDQRFVEIKLNHSKTIGIFLNWMPPEDSLLGALVCLSVEDKLLLHASHGEIAFHGYVEISTTASSQSGPIEREPCWLLQADVEP